MPAQVAPLPMPAGGAMVSPPQQDSALFERLVSALKVQTSHAYYDDITVHRQGDILGWKFKNQGRDAIQPAPLHEIVENLAELERQKVLSGRDRYNYGIWFPTWEANLWEICRLRVRNPGVPVHFLASGSNGSSKSEFASAVIIRAIMTTQGREFLCLTDDEPKSKMVQQKKFYQNLPNVPYKNERGRTKTTARGKMGYTDVGGFTENEFGADHGASCKFRFWSANVTSMEGIRPYCVWSDEEIPLQWLDAVDRRLLTAAEGSKFLIPQWLALLAQFEANPFMKFPRQKIGELMQGVHLITWTPSQGRTDTVNRFQDSGRIMEEIEADREVLPRRDKEGAILGGEIQPRLIYGKDPAYCTRMMYAWENPLGGNWPGMKAKAIQKGSKTFSRWWIYGVTERAGGSPFSNFNIQVQVRPRSYLPILGTWYHVVDPVASGGKCWTMIWAKVAAETQGYIAPGDIIICHEYPQCDDMIPGIGYPDPWASPGGKDGKGIPGVIQHAWPGGFEWRAEEIRRIEAKLAGWEYEAAISRAVQLAGSASGTVTLNAGPPHAKTITVHSGNRIMDSRAANTETENQTESKTIIEWMEDCGLEFTPAGRDSGAMQGDTNVQPGEQMLNNMLAYDRDNVEIDQASGYMIVSPKKGRGPKLWIMEHCTNTISGLQNYPGISNGGRHSSFKDLIDPIRYLVIAAPQHHGATYGKWTGGGSISSTR